MAPGSIAEIRDRRNFDSSGPDSSGQAGRHNEAASGRIQRGSANLERRWSQRLGTPCEYLLGHTGKHGASAHRPSAGFWLMASKNKPQPISPSHSNTFTRHRSYLTTCPAWTMRPCGAERLLCSHRVRRIKRDSGRAGAHQSRLCAGMARTRFLPSGVSGVRTGLPGAAPWHWRSAERAEPRSQLLQAAAHG